MPPWRMMPRKKPNIKKGSADAGAQIGEEVRIAVMLQLKKFMADPEAKETEFPSSFYAEERAYVHELAKEYGLRSKSRGKKGVNRAVTVYKREGSSIVQADPAFSFHPNSRQMVKKLMMDFPLSNKERQDLLPQLERDRERDRALNGELKEINRAMGRLGNGVAQVPAFACNQELLSFRQALPIWHMKEELIQSINNSQVIVIAGETGSGKTTQVPQFILDHAQSALKPCRIVCTQPRRISAVSVSERVALERDEKLGQSVGYQIRLESRVSPKTVLTYCTNGVLLRTLMGGDSVLSSVTHIIVDEVHERDRFSDFLLIALRDALAKFRTLRLILMSATIDTSVFTKYFNNCPVVNVPGKQFDVKEYFLEDILKTTGYMNISMSKMKKDDEVKKKQKAFLENWTKGELLKPDAGNFDENQKAVLPHQTIPTEHVESTSAKSELEPWLYEEMDKCIEEIWLSVSDDAKSQLLYLIEVENVSVDYQHSRTSATPLMVAAGRGCIETTERLLSLGANPEIRASNNWTALDFASEYNQTAAVEILQAYMKSFHVTPELLLSNENEMSDEDRTLLDLYFSRFNDRSVDVELCFALICHIHAQPDRGSILVFLPGYDVITTLRDRITSEERKLLQFCKFSLFTLHSHMQTSDQKRVFNPAPPNTRKIILSTNLAETSITIDDVVYVIDSGKVKEKSFDAIAGISSLSEDWISRASAKQRKGRAGRTRPGVCYHMFSRIRFKSLVPYQTPEILRMPLQELCLHTKLLAPSNTPIADFLARALEPPPFMVTRNSVQLLKTIDALDPWEDLTELGHHLLDLPVEPRLGKMLLYAVVLKCLDPVLTIVCTLAHKDPFVLPSQPHLRVSAKLAQVKLSAGTYSDHMAMLRAFQAWQTERANGREHSFCQKYFVSSATMEQVVALRAQLLGQLRASGFVRAKGGGDIRDLNCNAENWAVVKAALTAGFYPNIIRVDREAMQLRTMKECRVYFHMNSTLRDRDHKPEKVVENLPTDWLLFEEMNRVGRNCYARMCTLITPITVALFGGPMRLPLDALSSTEAPEGDMNGQCISDSEWEEPCEGRNTMFKLDDWVTFCVDVEAAQMAMQLRQKWNCLFLRRLRGPDKNWAPADDAVVQAVVKVLSAEEQAFGLRQPDGVGQRPRPLNIEFSSSNNAAGNRRLNVGDSTESLFFNNSENSGRSHRNNPPRKGDYSQDWSRGDDSSEWSCDMSPSDIDHSSNDGTHYFIIKAGSVKAIEASLIRNAWAFTPTTERRLLRVHREGKRVMLIFSMPGSGSFQGLAYLVGDRPDQSCVVERCSDLAGPNLGLPLPIKWVKYADIPFQATRHLANPYNENRRVQTSRDGQELEPTVGWQLCSLWDKVPHFSHVPHQPSIPPPVMRNKGPFASYTQHQHYYQPQAGGSGRPIRGGFQNGGFCPPGFGQHSNGYGGYGIRNSHPNHQHK